MLPRIKDSNTRVMWRAYRAGINDSGQLVLVGATGAVWQDAEFTARCVDAQSDSGVGIAQRMHTSRVFRPGELNSIRRTDTRALEIKRCRMHLEAGAHMCGIWGYKSPIRVQHEYLNSTFWNPYHWSNTIEVLCAVRVYGIVLEGEHGYRVSDADIEAMFVPGVEDIYITIDDATLKPAFDTGERVASFSSVTPFSSTFRRLDPVRVWAKLADTYQATQVIPVASGWHHIQQLERDYPDPWLKALSPKDLLNDDF